MIEQKSKTFAEIAGIITEHHHDEQTQDIAEVLLALNTGQLLQEFSSAVAAKIGGYPVGARVKLTTGEEVISTAANNSTDPNSSMAGWKFKEHNDLRGRDSEKSHPATSIYDETLKVSQDKINKTILTVESFGAVGDGVTDDSAAFQAYCDSPLTGANVILANRKAVYIIKKQIDCKGKGIVGNGFGKQSQAAYDLSSIRVMDGDYSNSNPDLANIAFVNVGAEVRDLQLVSSNLGTISGLNVSGYNTTISNINITGFNYQVYVVGASVRFSVSNLTSIGAAGAGFYFRDKTSDQSTTAYFNQCSWQWGNKAVVFAKEAYGCTFRDNIVEYMDGGFEASVFSNCIFEGNWCESTRSGNALDWIVNTTHQQLFSCKFGVNYIRSPWIDRTNPNDIAASNNAGGTQIKNSAVANTGATGAKTVFDSTGLKTRHASYFGSSNNPLSTRALTLTTQDKDASSAFITPIVIAPPNGALWYRNLSATDYTPVTSRYLIGANADNTAAFYGVDSYTKIMRKWTTFEHTTNTAGQFIAPLMLTFDSAVTDAQQQVNAGWKITKEAGTTGVYILQRVANTVTPMTNPNFVLGGIFTGSVTGTGAAVNYSLQAIETYSGSWTTYKEAAGFKIFFRDQAGAQVNVNRFTAMFTINSGF